MSTSSRAVSIRFDGLPGRKHPTSLIHATAQASSLCTGFEQGDVIVTKVIDM